MKTHFIVLLKTNKRCQKSVVFSLIPEIQTKSEIVLTDGKKKKKKKERAHDGYTVQ